MLDFNQSGCRVATQNIEHSHKIKVGYLVRNPKQKWIFVKDRRVEICLHRCSKNRLALHLWNKVIKLSGIHIAISLWGILTSVLTSRELRLSNHAARNWINITQIKWILLKTLVKSQV